MKEARLKTYEKSKGVQRNEDVKNRLDINSVYLSSISKDKIAFFKKILTSSISDTDLGLLFQKEANRKLERKRVVIPIVFAEDVFAFINNFQETFEELPEFIFPMHEEVSCGFEIVQSNMCPTIGLNSVVLANECIPEEMEENDIYMIYIEKQGLYCSRFVKRDKNTLLFQNDNVDYEDFEFGLEEVTRLYKVTQIVTRI